MVVIAARLEDGEESVSDVLNELAEVLNAVSKGEPAQSHGTELESALEIFSALSEVKLGLANGIVRAGKEQTPWLPRTTISPSS